MNNGFIAVHRKILNNPIFDNPNLFKMWMWCLLKATHTEHEQLVGLEMVNLKEGQFITGRFSGASELKVNENTWYKHMKLLEKLEMINMKSNNKYTIVTVVNWNEYQVNRHNNKITPDKSVKSTVTEDEAIEKEQQNNNKRTTKEQQNNTNNNDNNDNNDNNKYIDVFEYWNSKEIIQHRKLTTRIKKAMDKALKDYSIEEINKAISVYGQALHSSFYFNHKYTLEKFLKQSNGVPDWIEEGSMYENYMDFKNEGVESSGKHESATTGHEKENEEEIDWEERAGIHSF